MPKTALIWFKDCSAHSTTLIGEKGVDLGRLKEAKVSIPNGFVISSATFQQLANKDLQQKMSEVFSRLSLHRPESVAEVSKLIQQLIRRIEWPEELIDQILAAYQKLGDNAFVAIRTSQTLHNLPTIHATSLNIQGDANVIEIIKKTWAALYSPSMIQWLYNHKVSPLDIHQAVVIQKMVQSKTAGIVSTQNVLTHNKRTVVIEAVWGLGEFYYTHKNQADQYEVEKNTWEIIAQSTRAQSTELVRKLGTTKQYPVPDSRKNKAKLTKEQLVQLAKVATKLQNFLFFPQQIEWAIEDDTIYVLQTQQLVEDEASQHSQTADLHPLLRGTGVVSGLISGKVRICKTDKDFKQLSTQEIAVLPELKKNHFASLKKVLGIIVDQSVYPRDVQYFGIPIIAHTQSATSVLKTGQVVTLFGQQGTIYNGKIENTTAELKSQFAPPVKATPKHRIQLYVSSGEPRKAKELATLPVAGVGLLRAEYMVSQLGTHPKYLIHNNKESQFIRHLESGISAFCQQFPHQPLIYRLLDFTTHDFRQLTGGNASEPKELNPLIGYRGAFRQLSDTRVFDLELQALQKIRAAGYTNLHLMFPFVRSVEELVLLKQHVAKFDLTNEKLTEHWLMIDTPSVALQLEMFIKRGVNGIAIGARDLRALMTGIDIENEQEYSMMYQHDPAFMQMLRQIIRTGKTHNVPVMFCEHTVDQSLLELLVEEKVDRISVNATQIPYVAEYLKNSTI